MLRERIAFDICAAPFGSGFFFTCRTAEIPLAFKLWELLALLLLLPVALSFCIQMYVRLFGFVNGAFFLVITAIALIYFLRNMVALGLSDLDRVLMRLPVIGTAYMLFLRKESYYRVDASLCYLHLVPTLVKRLAEEVTAANGIKLLEQYELSPVLGELYKRSAPLPQPATSRLDEAVGGSRPTVSI